MWSGIFGLSDLGLCFWWVFWLGLLTEFLLGKVVCGFLSGFFEVGLRG